MTHLIRILGRPDELAGQFVKTFDHNGADGRGDGTFTHDPMEALHFPTRDAALEFYFRRSTRRPWRADGEPNCPLTASHAEFLTLGRAILEAAFLRTSSA